MYIYTNTQVHMYTYIYIYTSMVVYIYDYIHTHTHIYIYIYISALCKAGLPEGAASPTKPAKGGTIGGGRWGIQVSPGVGLARLMM